MDTNRETVTPEEKLWWKTSGYGYTKRIPVTLVEMSISGKRAYVRGKDTHGNGFSTYVKPTSLEPRHE